MISLCNSRPLRPMKTTAQVMYIASSPPFPWNHLPNTPQGMNPATLTVVNPRMPRNRDAFSVGAGLPWLRKAKAFRIELKQAHTV